MPRSIEIKIGADTREFDRKIGDTERRFKSAIDSESTNVAALRTGVTALSAAFVAVGVAAVAAFTQIGRMALDAAIKIDQQVNSLKALTGSMETAKKRFAELSALAQKTPGLTTNLAVTLDTQLRILNTSTQTINRLLPVIGRLNAISPLGDPRQFVNNLTQLITQNFERQDLKELVGQSPFAGQLIKQIFNVDNPTNSEAIRAAAKKMGVTTVEKFAEEFIKAGENNPILQGAIEGLGGQFDKLRDRLDVALAPLGEQLAKIILPLFDDLVKAAETYGKVAADVFRENRDDIITMAKALGEATIETGRFLSRVNDLGQSLGLWGSLRDSIQEVALMAATASDLLSGDFSGSRTRKLAEQFSLDKSARGGSPFLESPVRNLGGIGAIGGGDRGTTGGGGTGKVSAADSEAIKKAKEAARKLTEQVEKAQKSLLDARNETFQTILDDFEQLQQSIRAINVEGIQTEALRKDRPRQLAAFNVAQAERLRQIDLESATLERNTAEKARKDLEKLPIILSDSERFMRGFADATESVGDAFERFGSNVSRAFSNVRDLFNGLKQAVLGFFNDLIGSALSNLVRNTLGGLFGGGGGGVSGGGGSGFFRSLFGGGDGISAPPSVSGGVARQVSGAIGGGGGILSGIFGGGGGSSAAGGGFSLGGLAGGLAGAAPLLGLGLGSSLGGQSGLGQVFGALGGGAIGLGVAFGAGVFGAGGGLAAASLAALGPAALIGAPLIVGAILLGKAKQRRSDEQASGEMLRQALAAIDQLAANVSSGSIDGSQARAIFENQILGQFIQQIKTLKTKSVVQSRLTNQVQDLRNVFEARIPPLIAQQAQQRQTSAANALNFSQQIPEFATGGRTAGGLAVLHSGEMVLNQQQQAAVRSMAGPSVFSRAGVPGVNRSGRFDVGGIAGRGGETSIVIDNLSVSLFVGKDDQTRIVVNGGSTARGRQVTVNNVKIARTNREL